MDHAESEGIKIFAEFKILEIPEFNLTIDPDPSNTIFDQYFFDQYFFDHRLKMKML